MRLKVRVGAELTADGDQTPEHEPSIVVLIDRRGRRLMVPVTSRARRLSDRPIANVGVSTFPAAAEFTCGTIH